MVETKIVRLLKTGTERVVMKEKTVVHDAVERAFYRVVLQGTVDEIIYMKVDKIALPQDFAKQLTAQLIENVPSTVPISHLIKQHVLTAVADKAKLHVWSIARFNLDNVRKSVAAAQKI